MPPAALACALGVVLLPRASVLFVDGAASFAARLRIPTLVAGTVVVGIGTSTPEPTVSSLAAASGNRDLGVGNVLGSNLFNNLAVGGVIGVVGPGPINDRRLAVGGIVLMALTVAVASALLGRRQRLVRWEALSLLAIYAVGVPLIA